MSESVVGRDGVVVLRKGWLRWEVLGRCEVGDFVVSWSQRVTGTRRRASQVADRMQDHARLLLVLWDQAAEQLELARVFRLLGCAVTVTEMS